MKTKIVHIDVVMAAFREYMRSQLLSEKLIPFEERSFERCLIREVVKQSKAGQLAEKKERPV